MVDGDGFPGADPEARAAVAAHRAALSAHGGQRRIHRDRHGVKTVYTVWRPQGEPRAIAQILHGVGEHSARYLHVVEALLAAGFVVVADDHRGHGETGVGQHGRLDRLGRLGRGGMKAVVDAAHAISVTVRQEYPDKPLTLLGHSWGSFLAQKLVNRFSADYAAVVLTGTALALPGSVNGGDFNKPFRRDDATGFEWLSRDAAVGAAAAADPLMFGGTGLQLFGVRGSLAILTAPTKSIRAGLPILIAIGSEDPVGGTQSVRRLEKRYRARGLTDVTVMVYPGARHEVYNETNSDDVIADVVRWLLARL